MLDEFQDILDVEDGERLIAIMRGRIQLDLIQRSHCSALPQPIAPPVGMWNCGIVKIWNYGNMEMRRRVCLPPLATGNIGIGSTSTFSQYPDLSRCAADGNLIQYGQ